MKKVLLSACTICIVLSAAAQQRIPVSNGMAQVPLKKVNSQSECENPFETVLHNDAVALGFPEDLIGGTIYDLQSNGSTPFGRAIMFDDGTFGAVWTRGTSPTAYPERGTGYNYFDGTSWSPEPTARIETVRTGWPSLSQLGESGEVVVAHGVTGGLIMNKRITKGTGAWTQSILTIPSGVTAFWWSRMVTGGADKNSIHIIGLTLPTANGGTVYQGQDGAILYYRSTDGGASWTDAGTLLPGMGSTDHTNFTADAYSWVEPMGDKIAFIVSDTWNDMFVMKSEDNGATWQKTVIWQHPYPHWNGEVTDTIYCPDGSAHGAFDKNGKLHIVFGVNREMSDGAATSWFPFVDGVAYWNEDMPAWVGGDQLHCLDPNLLYDSGNLVGWMQDTDGNGSIDLVANTVEAIAKYYVSPSSFPQIAFDDYNNAVIIYSSITEGFDNGTQDYRHIWARASSDNGASWGKFIDLTDDPVHMFDECVFPVICARSDASEWNFIYQYDNEPGLAIRGDMDPTSDNYISFYHISKIINKIEDPLVMESAVSNFYPNPATKSSLVDVTLAKDTPVRIAVSTISGQQVAGFDFGVQPSGIHSLTIDVSNLRNGVYLCTFTIGKLNITRKMVVK